MYVREWAAYAAAAAELCANAGDKARSAQVKPVDLALMREGCDDRLASRPGCVRTKAYSSLK